MKKIIFLIAIYLFSVNCLLAQNKNESKIKVLLLGTFHFATAETEDDIMTEKRQKEILELVNKLYEFKPDKIFIERNPEFEYANKIDKKYQEYLEGKFQLSANEIYQLGFRLAKMLKHKKVFQADHPSRFSSIYGLVQEYAKKNGQTEIFNADSIGTTKPPWQMNGESAIREQKTILDFFRYKNSKEYQTLDHGFYLSVFPRLGDTTPYTSDDDKKDEDAYFIGAELVAEWYKRNVKIYAKVLTQLDYQEERILIIFGDGHISILRHLFESNPAFKVEVTNDWLK